MKKQLFTLLLGIFCAGSSFAGIYQIGLNSTNVGTGTLNGLLETPPNSSTATGIEVGAGLSYDSGTMLLNVNLVYGLFGAQPLTGNFLGAHIHQGAVGVSGPIAIDLTPINLVFSPTQGFFSGSVPMTVALENQLFSNNLYIEMHSTAYPAGEIRAQLIPVTIPEPGTFALLGVGVVLFAVMRRK